MPRKPAALVKPHEKVDRELCRSAAKIAGSFFGFVDLAARAIDEQVYVHFGFDDPMKYFDQRVGVKYRTVKRWLAIRDAVQRLPEAEQPAARKALAAIGAHKAGVLAPALGQAKEGEKPPDWRELVKIAEVSTEEALQEHVSELTGAGRRKADGSPGQRFLNGILLHMHPDIQPYVEAVFDAIAKRIAAGRPGEDVDPRACFLVMCDAVVGDLQAQGMKLDIPRFGG